MSSLQHYGVLGMKWGHTQTKTTEDLKGQKFGETKVYETLDWLKANPVDWSFLDPIAETVTETKESLAETKKKLYKIAGKPTTSLEKEITAVGEGVIKSMANLMKKALKK